MMARLLYKTLGFCFILQAMIISNSAHAVDTPAEIQKKLNEQTLSKPFSVESEATLNSALNAATERGKPTPIRSVNPSSAIGYYGNYYQPYYGLGYGYGFGYYRPYSYYRYTPYYSRYYW